MDNDLELNNDGNIKLRPITGWAIHVAAGILGILRIQYVENQQELEGTGKSLQLALTAQQCQQLSEALTRLHKRLLESQTGKKPPQ
jgi:hypothetical protein